MKHRHHVVQVGRGGTFWRTPVPGNEGDMHLHLPPTAVRVDDGDPLTHPDFAERLDLGVIVYDGHSVDCVRRYHHQLSSAALQTLLAYRDPDPATPYPPDFITLMAVQSDAQIEARNHADHPDTGSSIVLAEKHIKRSRGGRE
jgi:hypothetical protein